VFGSREDTLASVVVDLLRERRERLVVCESCTGGMLGELITTVGGSSDVFMGGWITYANDMKIAEVGVPPEVLAQSGAVSEPVARQMALGALRASRLPGISADHALAITGVAGPGGGTAAKPVGDVFIARASRGASAGQLDVEVRRFRFPGDRAAIRERAAKFALAMLRLALVVPHEGVLPRLLWEVERDGTVMAT
jgi:nicotinamide-nucleotide amidase